MKAVVQRVKNFVSNENSLFKLENAAIVFLLDSKAVDSVVEKVLKLKMWNDWKDSALDLNYSICLIFKEKIDYKKNNLLRIIENEKGKDISYINDGPCTFIL